MRSTIQEICVLVVGATILGGVINSLRPNPLPWRYVKPVPSVPLTPGSEPGVPGLIGLEELRKLSSGEVLIIDARPPLFFKRSHIPGAINIAKQYLARDISLSDPVLRRSGAKRMIVYCAHDDCEDAQVVAEELSRIGFQRVAVYKGGWKAWKAAGLPEEKG
jgi:rhodanese-related sulfurtransferase